MEQHCGGGGGEISGDLRSVYAKAPTCGRRGWR